MATISNIFIDAGSDYTSVITVAGANGLPLNLSTYTVKSQMRRAFKSSQAHDFDVSVYSPSQGLIKLDLSAAQSEQIEPGRWLYDIEITDTVTGSKRRVLEGVVTITPQITQI